jgi:membrane-associated protease RseP (regulator of RpoE activity)
LREGKKNTTRAVLGKREDDFGYGDAMEKFKMDSFKFDMPAFKFDMPPMQHFDFKFDGNAPDLKIYKDFAPFQGMHPFGEMGGPKLGVTLKETESGNGLEISSVAENSVAEKAGLQKGDIVTKAAGKDVNNIGEMVEIIAANRENSFDINYLRNGKPGKAAIKFDKKTKEISL